MPDVINCTYFPGKEHSGGASTKTRCMAGGGLGPENVVGLRLDAGIERDYQSCQTKCNYECNTRKNNVGGLKTNMGPTMCTARARQKLVFQYLLLSQHARQWAGPGEEHILCSPR